MSACENTADLISEIEFVEFPAVLEFIPKSGDWDGCRRDEIVADKKALFAFIDDEDAFATYNVEICGAQEYLETNMMHPDFAFEAEYAMRHEIPGGDHAPLDDFMTAAGFSMHNDSGLGYVPTGHEDY